MTNKSPFYNEFASADQDKKLATYSQMIVDLESPVQDKMKAFVESEVNCRVLHAVLGCASESGELADQIKKSMAYGKDLDLVNVDEEMGDILWYIQLYCNVRGIELVDLMAQNYSKLRTRYGAKFSQEACFNRNLEAERTDLETSSNVSFRTQNGRNKNMDS